MVSEVNGVVASDLFGLSQPLTKLIEVVGCGVGKIYEPWHIGRMAKAKAREIEIISGAISDNLHLPVGYDDGDVSITSKETKDLVIRAQNRFLFQEMKKQQNIENVISNAYIELKNVDRVSDAPVEEDWISEFFDCVANVSTEKMQVLWGKLLAGEVNSPGSFSMRTLEVLRRLSIKEANIFKETAPFVLQCKGDKEGRFIDYFLMPDATNSVLEKYDITFSKIMLLSEAGLISENSLISIGLNIEPNQYEMIKGINKSIKIKNLGSSAVLVAHSAYMLTEAGKELWPIVLAENYMKETNMYLLDCVEELKRSETTTMGVYGRDGKARKVSFEVLDDE